MAGCQEESELPSDEFFQNLAEQIGPQWMKIGRYLGIKDGKLQALNSNHVGNMLEAIFQMLSLWRQEKGVTASYRSLAQAFRDAKMNRLAEHVCKGELPRDKISKSPANIVLKLKKDLKWFYLNKLCKVPVSPWEGEKIPIQNIYTNVELLMHNPDPRERQLQVPLDSHHKLFSFEKRRQQGTRSILRGKAGSGKSTTVARLAYDWAVEDLQSPLTNYDILFVLKMRYMPPDQSFGDAIMSQLLPRDGQYSKEILEEFVLHQEDKIAIIFDGYDEYSTEEGEEKEHVLEMLRGDRLRHCCVLVTMRPWKALESKDLTHCTVYEVKGFSSENVDHYILEKSFKKDSDAGHRLISYLAVNNLKENIACIPLLTSLLCHLWKSDPAVLLNPPSRLGQLFECLCSCFNSANRIDEDELRSSTDDEDMDESDEVDDIIQALGETALDGLFKERQELTFLCANLKNKIGMEVLQKGKVTGLLSFEEKLVCQSSRKGRKGKRRRGHVSFYHKVIQEYCAGSHLAKVKEASDIKFKEYLHTLQSIGRILDLAYVLLFASWRSEAAARDILTVLLKVFQENLQPKCYYDGTLGLQECHKMQKYLELCLQVNYEAQSCGAMNGLLCQILEGGVIRMVGISSYTSEALAYYFKYIDSGTGSGCNHHTIHSLQLLTLSVQTTSSMRELSRLFPSAEWLHTAYMQEYVRKEQAELEVLRQSCATKYKKSLAGMDHWNHYEYVSKYHLVQILEDWQCSHTSIQPVLRTMNSLRLTTLHLSGQNLSHCIQNLAQVLQSESLANLQSLNLGFCNMEISESNIIAKALGCLVNLEDLNLTSNTLGPIFAETLAHLTNISSLFLEKTLATPEVSVDFAKALGNLKQLTFLEYRRNEISERGAAILTQSLRHLTSLEHFRFSLQGLSPRVISNIVDSLGRLQNLKNLQLLHTSWPNELCRCLADVVGEWKNLEDLRISGRYLEELEGFPTAEQGEVMKLVKGACGLEYLHMFSILQVCIGHPLFEQLIHSFSNCSSDNFEVLRITKRLLISQDTVNLFSNVKFLRLW